jgi:phosphate:Na+ symporter
MGTDSMVALAGGLGMFLLGIHHLTEGLKGFAGDSLRRGLQKLVSGKWSGLLSGAVFTALVQSSSAAILTVIGFVSAGLVTHAQAVAVVLGANLGTTATTWLVAVLGFKVKITAAALPMIGLGGFLWLLGKGRIRAVGAVLAGFGLLFTGIEYLQNGMAGVEWNLEGLGGGMGEVWLLAGIGVVMTIVMQSSSAAGATTLVALAAGTINLDQAFAMVVGQNIGTTATAALAAIGGGLAVKRTAIAHIFFNSLTGVVALLLLAPMGEAARWLGAHMGDEGVLSLAAFHTLFNLAGVILFFPWLNHFARMIEWMTGRGKVSAVARLDATLAKAGGPVAMEAAWRALVDLSSTALRSLADRGTGKRRPLGDLQAEILKVADFIHGLRVEATDPPSMSERRVRLWHALDHLRRLAADLAKAAEGSEEGGIAEEIEGERKAIAMWLSWASGRATEGGEAAVMEMARCSERFAALRKARRAELLERLGSGAAQPEETMASLEILRWLDGAHYHAWRLSDSLWQATGRGSSEAL